MCHLWQEGAAMVSLAHIDALFAVDELVGTLDALERCEHGYLDDDVFADPFLAICKDLRDKEAQIREGLEKTADHLLTRNRIFYAGISREEEIVDTLIALFGRRKGTV